MATLKGPRVGGIVRIGTRVEFTDLVQSSFFEPWGTQWFVDSISGDDSYDGRGPSVAKATIQAAVTAAGRGDAIYIRPGVWNTGTGFDRYTEDVTIASGVSGTDMTNAGISLVGITTPGRTGDFLGVRWKHATTANLTNNAPAVSVENIGFFSEGATYGALCQNDGATKTKQGSQGTSFYNCAFKGKGLFVTGGGDGFTVEKTRFQCAYTGTVADLNYNASANPGRRLTVRNCEWLDGNGVVPSAPCITIAPPLTEMLIRDCHFPQLPTGSVYIATAGAVEGLISSCYFNIADLDTDAHITLGTAVVAVNCWDKAGIAAVS